jgi:hypothetical protein
LACCSPCCASVRSGAPLLTGGAAVVGGTPRGAFLGFLPVAQTVAQGGRHQASSHTARCGEVRRAGLLVRVAVWPVAEPSARRQGTRGDAPALAATSLLRGAAKGLPAGNRLSGSTSAEGGWHGRQSICAALLMVVGVVPALQHRNCGARPSAGARPRGAAV